MTRDDVERIQWDMFKHVFRLFPGKRLADPRFRLFLHLFPLFLSFSFLLFRSFFFIFLLFIPSCLMTTVSLSLNKAIQDFQRRNRGVSQQACDEFKAYVVNGIEPVSKAATLASYLLNGFLLEHPGVDVRPKMMSTYINNSLGLVTVGRSKCFFELKVVASY